MALFGNKLKLSLLASLVAMQFGAVAAELQQVSGIVKNAKGQPVANAKVHLHGRQQYVITNAAGEFQIAAPQDSQLHIAAKGYGDAFVTVTDAPLTVALQSGGIERIRVSASGLHHYDLEMAAPVSVLAGESLHRHTEPTIGETLKYQPGVHANYYGPVASSPVIRGLDGPRVKMLSNGLDTADVSRIGPDHAITADAITTEQIEVLRGPATLLYGSGAIGGVVNIVDNRIPRQLRSPQTLVDSIFNTVSDEFSNAISHDGATEQLAWHLDGFDRQSNEFNVPSFTNDQGETFDKLANSWLDNQAYNGGLSWIGSSGLIGFSYGHLDSKYGIPGHQHHADEAAEQAEKAVSAAVKQDRVGLAAEWYSPIIGVEAVNFAGSYTDYQHAEIEGGVPGTQFKNQALESRLSLEHQEWQGWHGLIGLHWQNSEFAANGDEAFTPPTDSKALALFALEERSFGDLDLQLGLRAERNKHQIDATWQQTDLASTELNAGSVSAGLVWKFQPGYHWSFGLSQSARSPSAAEIYANGLHLATRSYELGLAYQLDNTAEISPALAKVQTERARNIDLGLHKTSGDLTFSYNFFYNQIDNFVYQQATGLTLADLHQHKENAPESDDDHSFLVYHNQQADIEMYGMEFSMTYRFDVMQQIEVFADSVRAQLKSGGALPRIPPLKIGAEYQYQVENWLATVGVIHYQQQDRISSEETSTPGYTSFDASFKYYFELDTLDLNAYLKATNLTNRLALVHTSFIKDDAPLPGRAITFGVTARF